MTNDEDNPQDCACRNCGQTSLETFCGDECMREYAFHLTMHGVTDKQLAWMKKILEERQLEIAEDLVLYDLEIARRTGEKVASSLQTDILTQINHAPKGL